MKKIYCLFVIMLLFSAVSVAETVAEIRLGGAPNGKYTTDPEDRARASFEIMSEYRKVIGDKLEIGAGIGYQKHGKIRSYTDVQDDNLKVVVKETKMYDSIPIYLTGRYMFYNGTQFTPYIKANVGYSFNINNKNTNHYETINKNNGDILDSGYLRKLKAKNGIYYAFGVGVEYKGLIAEVTYNVNTADMKSVNYIKEKSKGTGDLSRLMFSIGYQYRFGRDHVPYYARDDIHRLDKIAHPEKYISIEEAEITDKKSIKSSNKKQLLKKSMIKNNKNENKVVSEPAILKDELPKEQRDFFSTSKQSLDVENVVPEGVDVSKLPKFLLTKIDVKDEFRLIPDKIRWKIVDKYEGKELNLFDLKQLGKELNNEYMKAGYVTTRVMLEPDQNITSGVISLVAVPGKIEEIILDEDTRRDRRRVFFAFPQSVGDILNIREIDQGIDNINRMDANDVKMDIVAGDTSGYSKIIVHSNQKRRYRAKLGYDSVKKDEQKIRVNFEFDDPFGLNDTFYMYYKGDLEQLEKRNKGKDKTDIFNVGYSLPIKNWELDASYSYEDERNIQKGYYSDYEMRTKTRNYDLKASRLIYRNADVKLKFSFGLGIKNERTSLDGTKLSTQDRDFTVANVGINGIWKLWKGMASYDITYYRGLNALRAKNDGKFFIGVMTEEGPLSGDNKYQFDKVTGNFSWYRPFNIGKQNFTFRTSVMGQYTNDALFSSEKLSMGSFDTVRGYSHSVSGDIGFYTRTEISYILPKMTNSKKLGQLLYRLRPFVGFDYGKTRDNYNAQGKKRGPIYTMIGYSAGMRYYGEKINLDLGVNKGDNDNVVKKDKCRAYVSATITF